MSVDVRIAFYVRALGRTVRGCNQPRVFGASRNDRFADSTFVSMLGSGNVRVDVSNGNQ